VIHSGHSSLATATSQLAPTQVISRKVDLGGLWVGGGREERDSSGELGELRRTSVIFIQVAFASSFLEV